MSSFASPGESFDDNLLQPGIDYLYCPACQKHVACIRTEFGWWEVECPMCIGECGVCKCHLREFCFGMKTGRSGPIPSNAEVPECPYYDPCNPDKRPE